MRRIHGCAFDLEGTVIDVEEAHHQGHLAAAAEFGIRIFLNDAYMQLPGFIGGPDDRVCKGIWALLDEKDRERITVEQILARDKFHYGVFLNDMRIEPRPGFLEFHEAVRQLDIPMAIGSLTETVYALPLLDKSGIGKLFLRERIILRGDVENLKPAPDVYLKTAQRMNIAPSHQVVFGDSPGDGKAARSADSLFVGMPVVLRGDTVGALVDTGADRIFFDWREIKVRELLENLSALYE